MSAESVKPQTAQEAIQKKCMATTDLTFSQAKLN